MKTKLTITLICCISLNIGNMIPNEPKPVTAATTQINLTAELQRKQARHDLQQHINYLTTRANKTAYVYSGVTVNGWDCSGMVRWLYEQVGVELPHSANQQGHLGERVSIPKRGDIVVFAYKGQTDFYHSAIYLGNGFIINANREYGTTVIEPLNNFKHSQIRFIRIL